MKRVYCLKATFSANRTPRAVVCEVVRAGRRRAARGSGGSLADWRQVTERVQEAGVIVYPVRYDTLNDLQKLAAEQARTLGRNATATVLGDAQQAYELAAGRLQSLATTSGGRYYQVTLAEAKPAFTSIAEELRRYYWLGYYPANDKRDGSYRKLRVRVARPQAVVRTRDGYLMADSADGDTPPSGKTEAQRPKPNTPKP
jgi:VWFA-related protein